MKRHNKLFPFFFLLSLGLIASFSTNFINKEPLEVKGQTYTYEKVTSSDDINTSDTYKIGFVYSSNTYYYTGSVVSSKMTFDVTPTEAGDIKLESGDTGHYLKSGDKYINNTSGTNIVLGAKASQWVFFYNHEKGILPIANATFGYRFLGRENPTSTNVKAYAASNFAGDGGSYPTAYLYKPVLVSFGELHHIKVNALPNKTSYLVGETFSSEGLSLIGYDGANEETANTITITDGFTTNYDNHVFVSGDVGTKPVTVTYQGKTTSFNILVESPPIVESNLKLHVDDFNTTSYAANNGEHEKVSIDGLGTLKYFTNQVMKFKQGDLYYMQWQASNGYMYNISSFAAIHSIIIDKGSGVDAVNNLVIKEGATIMPTSGTTISPTIEGTKSIYFFSSNKPFFYISTGVISRIETLEVIPKKTVDDANDWADTFLSTTGAICKNDNTTDIAALTSAWATLKSTYQGLGADSKNYFVLYNDTSIASTKVRYIYIVNKYGLDNFIKDYEGNLYLSIVIDNPLAVNKIQNIYIVIIISLLGLTTLVGFYFISKKKKIEII